MTDMTVRSAAHRGRQWIILRRYLRKDVATLPVIWVMFMLGVGALVAAVASFRTDGIEVSGMSMTMQITHWFVGAYGVYLTAVYLPLYVTHGFTRRGYAMQMPFSILAFVAMYAVLMTLGFVIETAVYGVFGWPQALMGEHLYTSADQYHLIFVQYFTAGLVWMAGGAMLGAAFYRSNLLGAAMIPIAILLALTIEGASGALFGFSGIPGLSALIGEIVSPSVGAAFGTGALLFVIALGITWLCIRDLPIRSKTS